VNTECLIDIPDATDENWTVEHFEVTKRDEDFQKLRACNPSSMGRWTPAGRYNALKRGETIVMSTTPDELRDLSFLKHYATGDVLITGLGLGCAACVALSIEEVETVTVIEKDPSVIRMVEPALRDVHHGRLIIVNDDAFTWKASRGSRFSVAWHDIWDYICADNLDEMKKLKSRYRHRTGRQGCWCESECRRNRW